MDVWTRDALVTLKEDDLTRQVLVPLFQAMGYHDVRFFGGGVLEQGKDLVMWLDEPIKGRVNYAVVVKGTPITGEAVTGRVIDQLRQAFGKPFPDAATQEHRKIHECFVVTPHEIRKEGTHTLESLLANEPFRDHVTFIDGVRLWELVEAHLASKLLLGRLFDTYQQMRTVVPQHDFDVELGSDGVTFRVQTTPAALDPIFSDTPEGRATKTAFEQFLKTGETTDLPFETLHGLPAHELIQTFGGVSDSRVVQLRSQVPQGLQGSLRFEGPAGQSVTLPHIQFEATAGSERIRFSNENQNTPFKITIIGTLNSVAPMAHFQYSFDATGWCAHWLALQQKILQVIYKGCRMWFADFTTGIERSIGVLEAGHIPPPDAAFFAIVNRLDFIEAQLKQPLLVPQRTFFTPNDIRDIEFIHTIVTKGQHRAYNAEFTILPPKPNRSRWIEILRKSQVVMRFEQDTTAWNILDTTIQLGPAEIRCNGGRVTPVSASVDDAVAMVEHGDPVTLRLVPVKGKRVIVRYLWWYKNR